MRQFAAARPDEEFVQQAVAQILRGHNIALLERLKAYKERRFYAGQAIQNGWTRAVLVHQIASGYRQPIGRATVQRGLSGPD